MIADEILNTIQWSGGIAVAQWSKRSQHHEDLDCKGVYIVVRTSYDPPVFLAANPVPVIKGRKHRETPETLSKLWVPGSAIMYIGKAGGKNQKSTLRTRLNAYVKHGFDRLKYSHWGGRLIWQVCGSENFLLYWICADHQEPSAIEEDLIARHVRIHGKKPFANLRS